MFENYTWVVDVGEVKGGEEKEGREDKEQMKNDRMESNEGWGVKWKKEMMAERIKEE